MENSNRVVFLDPNYSPPNIGFNPLALPRDEASCAIKARQLVHIMASIQGEPVAKVIRRIRMFTPILAFAAAAEETASVRQQILVEYNKVLHAVSNME